MQKVWCQLGDRSASKIEISADADVDDLKTEILKRYASMREIEDSVGIAVFRREGSGYSEELRPSAEIPNNTTDDNPLVFREKREVKKPKISLPLEKLVEPKNISVPSLENQPAFVCRKGWLEEVKSKNEHQLARTEERIGIIDRISTNGSRSMQPRKTRALCEVANMELNYNGNPVAVIYVTFNDYASLDSVDQDDPMQALLVRIAFAALKSQQVENTNSNEPIS